jgi:hypothetical protein
MDGEFHFKDNKMSGQTKETTKEIDDFKDKLAKEHDIEVIRINCYKPELEFIKNSIYSSKLFTLFNLSQIDWDDCLKYSTSNIIKAACNIWNQSNNIYTIMDTLKIGKSAILRYLKRGKKLHWCNYDPKEERIKNYRNKSKCVYCIEYNQVYNSIVDASKQCNINDTNISRCCLGKQKTAGKDSKTGKPLHWIYYEDYLKQQNAIA